MDKKERGNRYPTCQGASSLQSQQHDIYYFTFGYFLSINLETSASKFNQFAYKYYPNFINCVCALRIAAALNKIVLMMNNAYIVWLLDEVGRISRSRTRIRTA